MPCNNTLDESGGLPVGDEAFVPLATLGDMMSVTIACQMRHGEGGLLQFSVSRACQIFVSKYPVQYWRIL